MVAPPSLAALAARLHGLTPEEARRRLAYGTLVSTSRCYVFTETPKAACSTFKHLLASLDGRDVRLRANSGESTLAMSIHDPSVHGFPSLMALDEAAFASLLRDSSATRFCVVRNPYARLVSAWADKVRLREPGYAAVWRAIGRHAGSDTRQCPAFAAFASWVCETQDVARCNPHWRGMTWLLLPDLLDYTHVLRTEDLATGLAPVLARIAPGNDAGVLLSRFRLNESLPVGDWRRFYDEDLAARVHAFYAEDFRRYGYAADSWHCDATVDDRGPGVEVIEARALAMVRARNDVVDALGREATPLHAFLSGNRKAPDFLREAGVWCLARGNTAKACELLAAALRLRPGGAIIRLAYARALFADLQKDEAFRVLAPLLDDPRYVREVQALQDSCDPAGTVSGSAGHA